MDSQCGVYYFDSERLSAKPTGSVQNSVSVLWRLFYQGGFLVHRAVIRKACDMDHFQTFEKQPIQDRE